MYTMYERSLISPEIWLQGVIRKSKDDSAHGGGLADHVTPLNVDMYRCEKPAKWQCVHVRAEVRRERYVPGDYMDAEHGVHTPKKA